MNCGCVNCKRKLASESFKVSDSLKVDVSKMVPDIPIYIVSLYI